MRASIFLLVVALLSGWMMAGPSLGQGGTLVATLAGAAEVPGPGDEDGGGAATVVLESPQGRICYQVTVTDIAPATAAHIHEGVEGAAGPVKVSLDAPSAGSSSGCVGVEGALIAAISANPAGYYVNVHNDEYPMGAVRGQLQDAPEEGY